MAFKIDEFGDHVNFANSSRWTSALCLKNYFVNFAPIEKTTLPIPTEIRLSKDKRLLTVTFDDGERFELSAELLRVESPSAEVQGHDPSQKKIIRDKQHVEIIKIEPVGNYAVRLVFDDLHDTGIYSWQVLHRIGSNADTLMATYREKVAGKS